VSEIGEVYPLLPEVEGEYPTKEAKPPGFCSHRRTQFDKTSRRVHCIECGREVEAFTVLMQLAKDREQLDAHRDHTIRATRIAEARLAEIKRQERNAKARMRKANIPLDAGAVRAAEHEAHQSLRPAPRVSYGAVDPTTIKVPDSTEAEASRDRGRGS
jgi:hypothetical protein